MDTVPVPQDFLSSAPELDCEDAKAIISMQETIEEDISEEAAAKIGRLAARDMIVMRRSLGSSFNSEETQRMIRERRAMRDTARN